MEIKCLSDIHPKSKEKFEEVTAGKMYRFIEIVPGGYVRICTDLGRYLNYPVSCFDMEAIKQTGREFPLCSTCGKKFIGKKEDTVCKHCLRKQV